ncbi:carbohydrate-binding protein [Polaribacter sp. 20A6]|uniref:carbohydrate-binding protein n=1 Tax=Polaribacter sp. 20A6 TaxID=2687289 RepID=UPI0013FD6C6E|nr:carbohydrate-binding protein [Polaribacter sp. 20A6]
MNTFNTRLFNNQYLIILFFLCFANNVNALDKNLSPGDDIQAAIDEVANSGGGTVYLAAGTYILSASIKMSSYVTLEGEGTSTRLELPLDATYAMIVDDGTEPCINMTVRNMLLDGNIPESSVSHDPDYTDNPQQDCLGIYFDAYNEATYHQNVVIENVEIHNTVDGCHLKGVTGGYWDNVFFHHNGIFFWPGHNSYLRRVNNYTVMNSKFEDSYNGSGINCSWSKNLLFKNCQVTRSEGRGIRNAASQGFVVQDCIITDCGDAGIIANSEDGITTSNVDFRRNCVSGCETGITGGADGVAYDNNVYNNDTDYSLGSGVLQSGNTSDFSQSCADALIEDNQLHLMSAITNENPKQIVLEISKEIEDNTIFEGFSVEVNNASVIVSSINLIDSNYIYITLVNDISEGDNVTVTYVESGNVQTDDGNALIGFEDVQVDMTTGLPFEFISASIDVNGEFVTFILNNDIGTIHDQSESFIFKINDEIITTDKTIVGVNDIQVYPSSRIYTEDVVEVSYIPDSFVKIVSVNESELIPFSDLLLENVSTFTLATIPNKIEAEDYDRQNGTQLENCSEGGQNLAYIGTGDWAEYDVDVLDDKTYKATFRVASPYDGGEITILVDGNQKGIITVPNTGNWQIYQSVSVDMKISTGKHTIRLEFTESFNVNWMEFEETTPGNEADYFDRIEAEDYNNNSGTSTETCSDDDGGENVGSIRNGNWIMFNDIDLSDVKAINMRLANTNSGGTIEVRLGSSSGALISTVDMLNTGGWQDWETASSDVISTDGVYDVYLVFKTTNSYVGNINWFQLHYSSQSSLSTDLNLSKSDNTLIYPNPVFNNLNINSAINSEVEIFNISGKLMINSKVTANEYSFSTELLKPGIYIVKVTNENGSIKNFKLVKK